MSFNDDHSRTSGGLSLYKAIVTASIGGLEETFEALASDGLNAIGVPSTALPRLTAIIERSMQTPNSGNATQLLKEWLEFDVPSFWQARLRTSAAAYRNVKKKGPVLHDLHSIYNKEVLFTTSELGKVLDRFCSVRHSFAHQDSAKQILTAGEVKDRFTNAPSGGIPSTLWDRKAATTAEVAFVQGLNAVCAVRLSDRASGATDPVASWTVHETHALNALHLLLGIASSATSGLAEHLDSGYGVALSKHDRLALRVQVGAWQEAMKESYIPTATHVDLELLQRRPGAR